MDPTCICGPAKDIARHGSPQSGRSRWKACTVQKNIPAGRTHSFVCVLVSLPLPLTNAITVASHSPQTPLDPGLFFASFSACLLLQHEKVSKFSSLVGCSWVVRGGWYYVTVWYFIGCWTTGLLLSTDLDCWVLLFARNIPFSISSFVFMSLC